MSENVTNDPVVPVSPAELNAIMKSRAKRNLSTQYQASDTTTANLGLNGRLWWVAEFIWQAREAKLSGRVDDMICWSSRANSVAHAAITDEFKSFIEYPPDSVAPSMDKIATLCQLVKSALQGEHESPKTLKAKENLKLAISKYFWTNNRLPTAKEMTELKFRAEDVQIVFKEMSASLGLVFPVAKRGPK